MGMKLVTPVADPPMAGQSPDPLSADEIKRRKKEWKRRHDAVRTLDSWERYRALVDASEEAFEIIDIANREARFALIVMGALNAVPLVVLSRADAFSVLSRGEQCVMGGLFLGYAVLVLTFILGAIEALRPGRFVPRSRTGPPTPRTALSGSGTTRTSSSGRHTRTGRRGRRSACRSSTPNWRYRCTASH